MNGDGIRKEGDGGRDETEIDIMEKPWLDDRVQHTFHWDGCGDRKAVGSFGPALRIEATAQKVKTVSLPGVSLWCFRAVGKLGCE
jgi:hypothetical protein